MSWHSRLLIAVVCVAGLISLRAFAADKDEEEIRSLVPKITQAWETLDITKIDPYYAPDATLTFFDLASAHEICKLDGVSDGRSKTIF